MGLEEARSSFKSQDDGLALEGGSVGLYVPLCKFNHYWRASGTRG
jgi:hypothetical protein